VRSRKKFHINTPIKLGRYNFPVTCLSVGNPHTVMFVDDFDFDWHSIGEEIENHKQFPHRTNVEFVKLVNRKRIRLADWERGAGATGSSGTGAAAAVCASVMLGLTDHKCKVVFDAGTLEVDWSNETNRIDLTGPAEYIASGTIDLS
jgi:diaminopimelate epimerase